MISIKHSIGIRNKNLAHQGTYWFIYFFKYLSIYLYFPFIRISSSYNSINNKSMRDNRRNQRSQRRFSQTSQKKSSRVETRRIRNKKGSRKKKR